MGEALDMEDGEGKGSEPSTGQRPLAKDHVWFQFGFRCVGCFSDSQEKMPGKLLVSGLELTV